MSMHGVDIAGYQEGIDVRSLTADFVIVKATEGVRGTVYNLAYREMADAALASGKLLGFYHYANGGNPTDEADSFFDAIKDYRGKAIPCLDWEGHGNPTFSTGMDVGWCKSFLDRMADRMGATPMLYTGKAMCNTYDWSACANYPLWGAEYAYADKVYQGYQSDPWQSAMGWGAWGRNVTIHQYGYVLPKPNDGGVGALDGDIFYGTREDWQRMCGTEKKESTVSKISLADVAARIHEDIMTDDRNGYSQEIRWGGDHPDGTKHLTINGRDYEYRLGSYDCASSVITAWRQAIRHTPYEGSLDGATYTGDMEGPFVGSGLFTSKLTPAKRGDLYLRPKTAYRGGHVAMCQDGGNDGVYGYDCLSEMYWNELGGATGGKVGDQTGQEGRIVPYYNLPWTTVLHYNGKADPEVDVEKAKPEQAPQPEPQPSQKPGTPKNDVGIKYRAHCQTIGWCDQVRDGQVAGTTGFSKRLEAIRITPPDGVRLDVHLKVDGVGTLAFDNVWSGNDPVIGTTGQGRTAETMSIRCTENGTGMRLRYQAHSQTVGWGPVCSEGQVAGTDGRRLEAVRIWFE